MNQKSYLQKLHEKQRQKNKVGQTNNKKCKKKLIDSINLVKQSKCLINKGKEDHLILFKKTETTERSLDKSKEKGRVKGSKNKEVSNREKTIRPNTAREAYINQSLSKSKSKSKSPTTTRKNTDNLTERKQIKPSKKNKSPKKKSKLFKQLFTTPQKSTQIQLSQQKKPQRINYQEQNDEVLTAKGQVYLHMKQNEQKFVKIDQSKVEQQSNPNQILNIKAKKPLKQIKTTFSARKRSIIDQILLERIQNKKRENKHQFSIESRLLSSINEQQQNKRINQKQSMNNHHKMDQKQEIIRFKLQQQRKWKLMLQSIKRLKQSGDIEKNIDHLIQQITLNAQQMKYQAIQKKNRIIEINQSEVPKCSQNTLSEQSLSQNEKNIKADHNKSQLIIKKNEQVEVINQDTFANIAQTFQDTQLLSVQLLHSADDFFTINQQFQNLRSNGISLNDFFIHDKKSSHQLKQDLYGPRMAWNRLQSQLIIDCKLQVKLPTISEITKNIENIQSQPVADHPKPIILQNSIVSTLSKDQVEENDHQFVPKQTDRLVQLKGNKNKQLNTKIEVSLNKYTQIQSNLQVKRVKIKQIDINHQKSQKNLLFKKISDGNLYQNITNSLTDFLLIQFAHKILQNEKLLHRLLTNYEDYSKLSDCQQISEGKAKQPSSNQYAFWLMHRLLDYLVNNHKQYLANQVSFYYQCKPIDVLKYVRACDDPQNDDSYDIENDQLIQIPFFNLQKVYIFQTEQLDNIHYLPSYFSFNQCIYDSLNDIIDKIRPFGSKGKSIFSLELSHPIKGPQKIKQQILSQFTDIFNHPSDIDMIRDNLVHGQEGNFQIIYFVSLQIAEAIYNQSVFQLYNVYRKKSFQQ